MLHNKKYTTFPFFIQFARRRITPIAGGRSGIFRRSGFLKKIELVPKTEVLEQPQLKKNFLTGLFFCVLLIK
jgi:hypothetical protein